MPCFLSNPTTGFKILVNVHALRKAGTFFPKKAKEFLVFLPNGNCKVLKCSYYNRRSGIEYVPAIAPRLSWGSQTGCLETLCCVVVTTKCPECTACFCINSKSREGGGGGAAHLVGRGKFYPGSGGFVKQIWYPRNSIEYPGIVCEIF